MRIAIVGAHGVGKTKWAKNLSEKTGLPLIVEQARLVAKEFGLTNCDHLLANPDLARAFQWQVLNRQIQMQLKHHDRFISDRGTLDFIAYWKLYLNEKGPDYSGETKKYIHKARLHAWKRLDIIFYIPPSNPVIPDGFRLTGKYDEVDKYICEELELLKKRNVPVITITGMPDGSRLAKVLEVVHKLNCEVNNMRYYKN